MRTIIRVGYESFVISEWEDPIEYIKTLRKLIPVQDKGYGANRKIVMDYERLNLVTFEDVKDEIVVAPDSEEGLQVKVDELNSLVEHYRKEASELQAKLKEEASL